MYQAGLFSADGREELGPGAVLLREFAASCEAELLAGVEHVCAVSPLRHMETPGGFRMSVAMTNCGDYGWVSDRSGYRYAAIDPCTNQPWPAMPDAFRDCAIRAATEAGFNCFEPDACLINRYAIGAKLSLHQDKNEYDLSQPVVSVSLGLAATFQFGGLRREDSPQRITLTHGDVVVWGGTSRLHYHGVLPLKQGSCAKLGEFRINLTFRKAK